MLRSKDLNEELRGLESLAKIDKEDDVVIKVKKATLKVVILIAKLVRDVKTNQVTMMKANKIELVKDNQEEQTEEK